MVSGFTLITQQSSSTRLVQATGVLLMQNLSGDLSTLSFEPHIPLCSSIVFLSQREGWCFKKKKINVLFIYFWLCWVSCCAGFSPVVASGGFSLVAGLLIAVASLISEHSLYHMWAQKLWLLGPRAQVQ